MKLDILTFGEALVEIMRPGIDQPLDISGTFEGPFPSGAPFIFAVQAARLGAKVGAVGAVGDDAFGRNILNQLIADGVATDGVRVLTEHATGAAFVAYNADGSRDFVFHIKGAAAGQLSPELLTHDLFAGLKCLHIMGSSLSIHDSALKMGYRAIELAKDEGAKISFDLNVRPQLLAGKDIDTLFAPFLDVADILFATDEEAMTVTGAETLDNAISQLMGDHDKRIIVIHQGKAGCTVYSNGESHREDGFTVEEVDPTGAGDCFDAGFLVKWLEGAPLADCARFANACGAFAVTERGPMAGAKSLLEIERLLHL